ncbi:methylenetetrahydrofolate reductase 1 [Dispira parvispora]|uniref:Methylenetetrahydrofolate reductase 1 n=1 Tax=Dispira parvispora TaxID=1520584 RepID=A0A9W8AMI3_9FUNG|nr:methylenetetrahydrofolate reductase 1 [Dispira parvispora]
MKITDKLRELSLKSGKDQSLPAPFVFSLEFFPPKTEQGLANLLARIARMTTLGPVFVDITWGAGGSTADRTLELCRLVQEIDNVQVCMHLTCTNMDHQTLDAALEDAHSMGIRNLLALRGDPPREPIPCQGDRTADPPAFVHAIDLVRYIRSRYGDGFCIGVAGYPEGHPDASLTLARASPLVTHAHQDLSRDDLIQELRWLKAKVDAGADFVVSQIFFDTDQFSHWYRQCRDHGITVPILPNILPIQQYQPFRRVTQLCQVRVPTKILADLEPFKLDDGAVKRYGESLAVEMIHNLQCQLGLYHFHFTTLNLEASVRRIIERMRGIKSHDAESTAMEPRNRVIVEKEFETGSQPWITTDTHVERKDPFGRRTSSPSTAAGDRTVDSKKELREGSTFDEFPNGRWGDSNSPAFGDLASTYYAVMGSFPITSRQAIMWWGRPQCAKDVDRIFIQYLRSLQNLAETDSTRNGSLSSPPLPWCLGEAVCPSPQWYGEGLARLVEHLGIWVVASQPAVDGQSSANPDVGWGPQGGVVYQKPFIEFFATADVFRRLQTRLKSDPWVTFLASRYQGPLVTTTTPLDNMDGNGADDPEDPLTNALTWGIFPGKEVVQAALVDRAGFLAWKDEAFDIWRDWANLYPENSTSRHFLMRQVEELWLVNVVYNDYKTSAAHFLASVFELLS